MKKLSILLTAAIAFGFTACDDVEPNPPAQSNPELEAFEAADIKLAQTADHTLDLQTAQEAEQPVTVADITDLAYFPEGYDLNFVFEVALDNTFSKVAKIPATYVYNEQAKAIQVQPVEFEDAMRTTFTRNPATVEILTRIAAYGIKDGSTVRLGTPEKPYFNDATWEYTLKRLDTPVIESGYWLVGSFCNWQPAAGIEFIQMNAGDPYDEPVFTAVFEVSEAQAAEGYSWKIVPASAHDADNWTGAFGAQGDQNEGVLVPSPEAQTEAGIVKEAGKFKLTVDMRARTYTLAYAIDFLYVPGNATGTSDKDFQTKVLRLPTSDYTHYQGVARLRNDWYLTGQPSNKGIVFRPDGDATVDSDNIVSGKMKNDPTGEAKMPAKNSLYLIDANIAAMTYKASPITAISVIGSFNGWNLETAVPMKHASNWLTWTVENVTLDDGAFKLNCNGAWTISFGGEPSNIVPVNNGGDMTCEAGTYDLKLDFSKLPYTLTMTRK